MSLAVDGTWKAAVWNPTVWASGVWMEGAVVVPPVATPPLTAPPGHGGASGGMPGRVPAKRKPIIEPTYDEDEEMELAQIAALVIGLYA